MNEVVHYQALHEILNPLLYNCLSEVTACKRNNNELLVQYEVISSVSWHMFVVVLYVSIYLLHSAVKFHLHCKIRLARTCEILADPVHIYIEDTCTSNI